jgi:hypothetical protein
MGVNMKSVFSESGQWFKANLHTHTTASDGKFSAEERITQYKEKGYCVLAITDHGKVSTVENTPGSDFLVINGAELHPKCENGEFWHLVGLNLPSHFDCSIAKEGVQQVIDQIRQSGGETILAHPYWLGLTRSEMIALKGIMAMEVFNVTCTFCGKGESSVHWDDLLDSQMVLPAVAVDDSHSLHDAFQGWTMIKAQDLTVHSIIDALKIGNFYSSSGPEIHNITVEGSTMRVECSPVAQIRFLSNRYLGASVKGNEKGYLTSGEYTFPDKANFPHIKPFYTRIEIVDEAGRKAWSNPFLWE